MAWCTINFKNIRLPQNPLFIVGYPRSGTTVLQALLAAHPNVFAFPETHYFCTIEKQLCLDEYGHIQPQNINKSLSALHKKIPFKISLKERAALYRLARLNELTSKHLFEWIVFRLLQFEWEGPPEAPFIWIEKTPVHYNYLQKINNFYPGGKILAIIRHPVPAVSSRKNKFPFNQETDLAVLAAGWKLMISILQLFQQSYPESIRIIRYEDLVHSPYTELKRLESFLEIPIKKKYLENYYRSMSAVILPFETWKQDKKYEKITNMNPDHAKLISRSQAEYIESIVYTSMKRYGYRSFYSGRNIP